MAQALSADVCVCTYEHPFGVWIAVFLRNLKKHLKRVPPPQIHQDSVVAQGNFKILLERKQGLKFEVMEMIHQGSKAIVWAA